MPADKQLTSAEIDALCDSFEQHCKEATASEEQFPQIEEYLGNLSENDREEMLRELLIIEHHYRTVSGQALEEQEYHRRFAEHSHVVDEVLSAGIGHRNDTQFSDRTQLRNADDGSDNTLNSLLEAVPVGDSEGPSPTIGDYELLDELGRGGMGIVYRARQRSVDRLVALKVLRRDRLNELDEDSREMMIERFRTESQSAAQLEHDHIVPVFEVGEASGIHYYSMRYVPGESLAEVIAEHPLDNHSAAEAIEPIARALQVAHDKGVLHRDIKPRNIMIDDATGRPLLTDFGLAKLLESQQDMTHTGDVMGSPPYMSPEQATDAAHVTHAADIYSLGATLYHALTGRPPFQAATMAETMRQVWFEEPPTPRSLNPAIDRDLETICMKCLEKEPSRRYENGSELANELSRYLRGEPILSRPIGWLGQLQRWRRRNPSVANLTGAIVLIVLVSFIGTIYYNIQLRKSLKETQDRMGLAVSAVNQMTDLATKEDGLKAYGVDEVRREMLNASREYYDQFVERETNDPVLETERGKAYGRLADIEADLGNQDEAIRLYQQSVDVFRALEKRQPSEPNYTYLRAAYLSNLAGLYRDFGQLDQAEATLEEAYNLASKLHAATPSSVEFAGLLGEIHDERGVVFFDLREMQKAENARLEAVNLWQQICEVQPSNRHEHQLAASHNNLADFYRLIDKPQEAQKHFKKAREIWQALSDEKPLTSDYAAGVARCDYGLGILYLESGRLEDAQPLLMASEGRRRRLTERHRQLPSFRDDLATSLDGIGRLLHAKGELALAADEYRDALVIREDLRNTFPDAPKYEVAYAASQMNLGDLYVDSGQYAQSSDCFRVAIDVLQRVVDANPNAVNYRQHLAGALHNLALSMGLSGEATDTKASVELYQRALRVWHADELKPSRRRETAVTCLLMARLLGSGGEFQEGIIAATRAIETLEATESNDFNDLLETAYSARAVMNDAAGKHKAAVADWDAILALSQQPHYALRRGVSLARMGDYEGAMATLEGVLTLHEEAPDPMLLFNAACVISRAIEAVEDVHDLTDEQRKSFVDAAEERGATIIERLLSQTDGERELWLQQTLQDPDIHRLSKSKRVKALIGPTAPPDPEAE